MGKFEENIAHLCVHDLHVIHEYEITITSITKNAETFHSKKKTLFYKHIIMLPLACIKEQ